MPQGDSQHGPSRRFSHHAGHRHVRLPANISWPPSLTEKGLETRSAYAAERVPPAVLVFRAVIAMVCKGSWKVLGDLGHREDAAPLKRVWSSQLCLNLQRWDNLVGTNCPFSPGHAVGWVHGLGASPGTARHWGCPQGSSWPQSLFHSRETTAFPFSCICVQWGSTLIPPKSYFAEGLLLFLSPSSPSSAFLNVPIMHWALRHP